ncbi:hypothetical protein ACHAXN_009406 [Cyclotella atomus]
MSILSQCTARASTPSSQTFPQLPQITTYLRLFLGSLYGLSLGLRDESRGLIGALFGLNIITFLPMFWFNSYLDAKVDSYKSLNFAGVLNGFAVMMLVWITVFTYYHGEEEESLRKVIGEVVLMGGGGDDGGGDGGVGDGSRTEDAVGASVDMEDEF